MNGATFRQFSWKVASCREDLRNGNSVSENTSSRNCLINRSRSYFGVPRASIRGQTSPILPPRASRTPQSGSPPAIYQTVSLGNPVNRGNQLHRTFFIGGWGCCSGAFSGTQLPILRVLGNPLAEPLHVDAPREVSKLSIEAFRVF